MYHVEILEEAQRELKRLPSNIRHRIARTIDSLREDPHPPNAKEMADELHGFWRIRIEDYRIIYAINDDMVIVTIVRITKRDNNTYLGLT